MRHVAVTALAIVSAACAAAPEKTLAVTPPFAEARVSGSGLFVRLAEGIPLGSVVRLDISPVRPGMTLDEVRKAGGEPLASRSVGGWSYYQLRNDGSGLELAHITDSSSGGPQDKCVIVAEPTANAMSSLFSQELQALIVAAGNVRELTLHEHKRPHLSAFTAEVKEGKLYHLQWYSIEGIPGG